MRDDPFASTRAASRQWKTPVAIWLLLMILGAVGWGAFSRGPDSHSPAANLSRRIDRVLDDLFVQKGVDRGELQGHATEDQPVEMNVGVPPGESFTSLNAEISKVVEDAGGEVLDAVEQGRRPESPESVQLKVGKEDEVTHEITLRRERVRAEENGPPRIAVVFDDLGYSTQGLARELLELPPPITFAVLPGLAESEAFSDSARARGHHVILHLPMEPLDRAAHDPGPGALLVDLEPEENLRRLRDLLDGLGGYPGVSNHMGSRFTTDRDLMDLVLKEIRRRDLFFLDSRTTPYSVIPERARWWGVPYVTNNLFLDGRPEDPEAPQVQTARLAEIAHRRGHAVAIGHLRRETVDAVKAAINGWEVDGIRLVGLEDLMHREGVR